MSDPDRPLCPACDTPLAGDYCHECGEKSFSPADLSGRAIGQHVLESITDVDGKVLTSFRLLLTRPGQLTVDYLKGIRKNRLTPFQVLILVNVAYFIVVGFMGHSPFTTQLQTHTTSSNFFHQELASRWVAEHVANSPLTLAEYSEQFNAKVDLYAKSLVILFVPYFALVLALLNWFRHPPVACHLIMATHLTTYLLLVLMVVAPLLHWGLSALYQTGWFALNAGYHETIYSVGILAAIGVYYYLVTRRVFGGRPIPNALKALALSGFVYLGFLLYRVVLFFVGYFSL